MSGFNYAPPSYTSEPSVGEVVIDDDVLIENVKTSNTDSDLPCSKEILRPEHLNNLYNPGADRYFWTPASSPYATAFNTPNPALPEKLPIENYPNAGQNSHFNFPLNPPFPQGCLINGYGMPLQPVVGSNGSITQQPINVVVNANSNINQDGNTKYCPKCRVGVIVRKQSRLRQLAIILSSTITCCLCCTCCKLLKNNYEDMCSYCRKRYGHRGARVEKIKRSKRSCFCLC